MDHNPFYIPPPGKSQAQVFTLATVAGLSGGLVSLQFAGASGPTQKYYKQLQVSSSPIALSVGDTVLALKISGTYLVLGKIQT